MFVSQNLVQSCCATYLDQVLTQPWTKFWLNIFANFWVFLPVWEDAETTIVIVFSAKNENFKPTPKKLKNTICEYNCANWFFLSVFLHFCFFGFLNEKTKTDKIQNKTTKRKDDHKMQTTKPLSPVFKKEKTRQHRHNIIQINCLKWKQTTQEKQKNTRIKTWNWYKIKLPCNQHD